MDAESVEDRPGQTDGGFTGWLRDTNHNAGLIALIRKARRVLPGDPEFGDPLSTAGDTGAQAAARAADRLLQDREVATRELGLGALQLWQAITEKVSGQPANAASRRRIISARGREPATAATMFAGK